MVFPVSYALRQSSQVGGVAGPQAARVANPSRRIALVPQLLLKLLHGRRGCRRSALTRFGIAWLLPSPATAWIRAAAVSAFGTARARKSSSGSIASSATQSL